VTTTAATVEIATIRAAVAANGRRMTSQLARDLGVTELAVIRALPDGQAVELDVLRWEELIRALEPLGKVHVICTNGAVTLESFGQFGNFSTFGDYFNVQTATLDMHGVSTVSVQFYDDRGDSAFKVFLSFGGKPPSPDRAAAFEAIRDRFRAG
jgi:putative hemin transport protein